MRRRLSVLWLVLISFVLYILLAPGFLFNIPASDDDKDKLGSGASYADFRYWQQTLVQGSFFLFFLLLSVKILGYC